MRPRSPALPPPLVLGVLLAPLPVLLGPVLLEGDAHAAKKIDDAWPPVSAQMEVLAFSQDGKSFAVKIADEEGRSMIEVRATKKNKLLKSFLMEGPDDKRAFRKAKREFQLKGEPTKTPENPSTGVTLMSAQKGDKLNIYAMVSETCTKLYEAIPLRTVQRGKRKGEPATATAKQIVWDPSGKYVVIIYHQKIRETHDWEGDFIRSFKFKKYRASCGS